MKAWCIIQMKLKKMKNIKQLFLFNLLFLLFSTFVVADENFFKEAKEKYDQKE